MSVERRRSHVRKVGIGTCESKWHVGPTTISIYSLILLHTLLPLHYTHSLFVVTQISDTSTDNSTREREREREGGFCFVLLLSLLFFYSSICISLSFFLCVCISDPEPQRCVLISSLFFLLDFNSIPPILYHLIIF